MIYDYDNLLMMLIGYDDGDDSDDDDDDEFYDDGIFFQDEIELRRLRTENRLLRQRIDLLENESSELADKLIQVKLIIITITRMTMIMTMTMILMTIKG